MWKKGNSKAQCLRAAEAGSGHKSGAGTEVCCHERLRYSMDVVVRLLFVRSTETLLKKVDFVILLRYNVHCIVWFL